MYKLSYRFKGESIWMFISTFYTAASVIGRARELTKSGYGKSTNRARSLALS